MKAGLVCSRFVFSLLLALFTEGYLQATPAWAGGPQVSNPSQQGAVTAGPRGPGEVTLGDQIVFGGITAVQAGAEGITRNPIPIDTIKVMIVLGESLVELEKSILQIGNQVQKMGFGEKVIGAISSLWGELDRDGRDYIRDQVRLGAKAGLNEDQMADMVKRVGEKWLRGQRARAAARP